MIPRVLEPEVMDTPEEAAEYDAMDHAEVNRVFVDDLLTAMRAPRERGVSAARSSGVTGEPRSPSEAEPDSLLTVLDVGTGTALIPIELCRRSDFAGQVIGIDLAVEMLKRARRNIRGARLDKRIRVELVDAKSMPFTRGSFDVVMSNSIVHHIPQPEEVLHEMVRTLRPGGLLFIRDLLRPERQADVEHIVAAYAGREPDQAQQLFRQSLWASLTIAEVRDRAEAVGLPPESVSQTSDRHWTLAWRKGSSDT